MKVIAINGSPRHEGNTSTVLKLIEKELNKAGIEMEIVEIGTDSIHGCTACGYCRSNSVCIFKSDKVNETAEKIMEADGLILASPTYYGGITGSMKSFLDRLFFSTLGKIKNKVGTSFVTARRSGDIDALHQLNSYLQLSEFIIAPSQYWGSVYGMDKGECIKDEEGMQTILKTAEAMAWLIKIIDEAKNKIPAPNSQERIMTNFIR